MDINEQQKLILESKSKRIIVLACPGSGKTTTITNKIVQLHNNGVDFKRILCVTFTKKASDDMAKRISEEINISKREKKNISTLHSFGAKILYKYKDVIGLKDEYTVALKSDREEIAKTILDSDKTADKVITSFLDYVSSIKNGYEKNEYNFTKEQFDEYSKKMISLNLIDIDDFIYLPVKILENNKTIKNKVSSEFDYIFCDEYQDINAMQDLFLSLLINKNTTVIYVGDDDQSIYEFRGSNPNYILSKSQPDSGFDVFFLTTNYRSSKYIVDFSKKNTFLFEQS